MNFYEVDCTSVLEVEQKLTKTKRRPDDSPPSRYHWPLFIFNDFSSIYDGATERFAASNQLQSRTSGKCQQFESGAI